MPKLTATSIILDCNTIEHSSQDKRDFLLICSNFLIWNLCLRNSLPWVEFEKLRWEMLSDSFGDRKKTTLLDCKWEIDEAVLHVEEEC